MYYTSKKQAPILREGFLSHVVQTSEDSFLPPGILRSEHTTQSLRFFFGF